MRSNEQRIEPNDLLNLSTMEISYLIECWCLTLSTESNGNFRFHKTLNWINSDDDGAHLNDDH